MTWTELSDHRARMLDQISKTEEEIADHIARINLNSAPANFPQHVQDKTRENRAARLFISQIDAEFQMRPAPGAGLSVLRAGRLSRRHLV